MLRETATDMLDARLQLTYWMGNNQLFGQRATTKDKEFIARGWCLGYIHKSGNFLLYRTKLYDVIDHYF